MSVDDKQIIFSMVRVSKEYVPGKKVIKDISLSFYYGAKIGVLGLNGAGKSSLLRIIAGLDSEHSGEVLPSKEYTTGYLEQEPEIDSSKTVLEVVQEGVIETVKLIERYEEICTALSYPDISPEDMDRLITEQGVLQEKIEDVEGWELDSRLQMAMDALRCPPGDTPVKNLSGGERRRVAICRLLLQEPDILLLDEPTNHLDAETVHWLEGHLKQYRGTIIAVTHDRYFLDNVAGWILELDRGEGIPWKGNYSSWLEQKQSRLELEEKAGMKKYKTLQRELEWIRMAPRARQAKGKARLNSYEKLLYEESSCKIEDVQIYIPSGPRLGNVVIEAKNLTKAYGDRLLFEELSFRLPPAGIVGVIGANGAGKTTLFKLITGKEKPDSGDIKIGETTALAYVDQERDVLDNAKTVWEVISEGHDIIKLKDRELNSRAYVSGFNFSGTDQQKKVGDLSGGERNRVHLARMLKEGGNVLLLDEPTNDLDVNTLRALESALDRFAGCAVIISHDRWFLDRIATHMLAFEGDSRVVWFEGNYSDYEKDKKRRLVGEATLPKRIQYRKFSRI